MPSSEPAPVRVGVGVSNDDMVVDDCNPFRGEDALSGVKSRSGPGLKVPSSNPSPGVLDPLSSGEGDGGRGTFGGWV